MTINNYLQIIEMFLLPLVAVLFPILIGQRYGIYARKKSAENPDAAIGSLVGATLGLLAFMLAFTFDIVSDRYNARTDLLLDEVTNIRTAYLRAGLIPEPLRSDSKKILVEYVDVRVELVKDYSKRDYAIKRSQQMLDSLWSYAEALAAQDRSSEAYALFTSSVNDLVDLFNQRITFTFEYRVPGTIFYVLYFMAFFSMLMLGYQFGITGKENFMLNFFLSIVFAAVIWLIIALDRPESGLIRLNQAPLFSLQKQLHEKL